MASDRESARLLNAIAADGAEAVEFGGAAGAGEVSRGVSPETPVPGAVGSFDQ